jgi:hypothetical protein
VTVKKHLEILMDISDLHHFNALKKIGLFLDGALYVSFIHIPYLTVYSSQVDIW